MFSRRGVVQYSRAIRIGGLSKLTDLSVGSRGVVVEVTGSDAVSLRLLEMGLTPGVSLEVIGTAPLGDPIELSVRGYRLSVRKAEADRVSIRTIDAS